MITVVATREPYPETRVALTPDVCRSLTKAGHRIIVESGAGGAAGHPDAQYQEAGAEVVPVVPLSEIDVLAHVLPLTEERIRELKPGALTIGMAGPHEVDRVTRLAEAEITAMSFERLPRTSRAQSMDALSSQALAAGYRAVLEAAFRLPRFFPLAMTAAGTVPPAKVVVLGIGVAGLQAIATAKRLGATVSANDIRPSSAEEARSVGATFIDVGLGSDEGAGTGGYARTLGQDAATRQREALAPHIADADVLITTAAVPGRPAPRLVTAEMVQAMRPGSVAVDLAAPTGGNIEGSRPGEDVKVPSTRGDGDVTIVGVASAPSDLPADASRLFAKNVENVVKLIASNGAVVIDFGDDIVDGMTITHDGVNRLAQPKEA
ncbi:NAD(P) transhydrogenase subunit alpha [Tessaracoccus caeni]|uniref:NAD(P) transhydrogenase subunit alpha n=1 Tax=Tessaracoccus caeni TaxID=3031239 RepID=UPI0023DBB3C1|nr:NAD(P) transhydrogenase subunit alpha [Tessaracoccus caeni]MDF1489555.1 NAD(P) transhydrogenase subunit alpha [Tessaracoccus caeni]